MRNSQDHLKILFLPAWYPSEVNSVAGVFIKEHARAASLYNDIVVLYAYPDPSPQPTKVYRVSEDIEDGIRTIRVRYGGMLEYLRKKVTAAKRSTEGSMASQSKSQLLARLLRYPWMLIEDWLYFWGIFTAFRKLVKEGWKPNIIHAHVFTAGVPAVVLGKFYGIPVIITEHWSAFPMHLLSLPDRVKARFAMNRARIVLPVSDDLRKHIETYGVRNKFRIVPNTVNTEMFYPSPYQARESASKGKKLLFVGSLIPIKGIPYLLEALGRIKGKRQDFTLDIVGDGTNRSEYEELTARLGLDGMVKFHGFKPKEEVARFMMGCDFYVQASLWENLPCVLIEATTCGKPVIASDVGGIKEIINEENGILVTPKDVTDLKKAIDYMLDNYQDYSSEKIAQYAREKYSYETVGKMMDKVYRREVVTK